MPRPDPPVVPEKLAGTGSCSPSTFSFPSSILLTRTHTPAIAERQPSLALGSHFCETRNSAQDKYEMHLNLSLHLQKRQAVSSVGGNTLTGKMFPPPRPRTRFRGFPGRAFKLSGTSFCYLDKSRHGLISMFSNQTTFVFGQGRAVQFQGRRNNKLSRCRKVKGAARNGQLHSNVCCQNKWQLVICSF